MKVYNGKVYGVAVSDYGLEKGYLDYKTLAGIVGARLVTGSFCFQKGENYG